MIVALIPSMWHVPFPGQRLTSYTISVAPRKGACPGDLSGPRRRMLMPEARSSLMPAGALLYGISFGERIATGGCAVWRRASNGDAAWRWRCSPEPGRASGAGGGHAASARPNGRPDDPSRRRFAMPSSVASAQGPSPCRLQRRSCRFPLIDHPMGEEYRRSSPTPVPKVTGCHHEGQ